MKRWICLLLAAACIFLSSCGASGEDSAGVTQPALPANAPAGAQINYRGLDEKGQAAYNDLMDGLRERKAAIYLRLSEKAFDEVFRAALYDHPELLGVGHQGTLYSRTGRLLFRPNYLYSEEETANRQARLDQKIKEIKNSVIREDMDSFEKELALHDWLAANCRYDAESLNREDSGDEDIYTAFGALVLGRAVCEGYAKAFSLLMRSVEIPCTLVTGRVRQGSAWESHMWNAVYINGEGYYADPTWGVNDTTPGKVDHTYFNITRAQLLRDHEIESGGIAADSEKQNYFIRRGLRFAQYDAETKAAIRRTLEKSGSVELAFTNKDAYHFAMGKLVDDGEIYSLYSAAMPGEKQKELSVNFNDTQYTVQFYTA